MALVVLVAPCVLLLASWAAGPGPRGASQRWAHRGVLAGSVAGADRLAKSPRLVAYRSTINEG
jgi:hypothetical protein